MSIEVRVEQKGNGFLVTGTFENPDAPERECVIEGGSPSRLGEVILAMFKKPRKSPVKKGATV